MSHFPPLSRFPRRAAALVPALALALTAVLAAPAAVAGDDHRGKSHHRYDRYDDRGRYDGRHHGRYGRYDGRYDRRYDGRRYDDRDDRRRDVIVVRPPYYAPPPPRVVYRPGPPPHARYSRWNRGVRYDHRGYAPTYVVRDYRAYDRLYAPPRGYYWRRDDDGNFLLVALATGIIASVLFD